MKITKHSQILTDTLVGAMKIYLEYQEVQQVTSNLHSSFQLIYQIQHFIKISRKFSIKSAIVAMPRIPQQVLISDCQI